MDLHLYVVLNNSCIYHFFVLNIARKFYNTSQDKKYGTEKRSE